MVRKLLVPAVLLLAAPAFAEVIFVQSEEVDLGSDARNTLFVDVNDDGRPDIVSLSDNVDSLNVLLNLGPDGDDRINFGDRRVFRTGADPRTVAAGDFDGDGDVDLAVSDFEDDDVLIFSGDGTADFVHTATLNTAAEPTVAKAADLNSDGRDDLLVIESGNDSLATYIATSAGFSSRNARDTTDDPVEIGRAHV